MNTDVQEIKREAIKRLLTNFTSIKYHILVTSSFFFVFKVLSENGWITIVLGTLGLHAANEVGALVKETKLGAKK